MSPFLAAFALLAAPPAPAAVPAGVVHAELARAGRIVWRGDLRFALDPQTQMIGVDLRIPDPAADGEDEGRERYFNLSFYPEDMREARIPVAARYRRRDQEYYYEFGWTMPLAVSGQSPLPRTLRIESSRNGYFFLRRGERKVIRLPDGLVLTFRR